jgi:hypothetical protein
MLYFCNVKNQGSGIAAAQREETGELGLAAQFAALQRTGRFTGRYRLQGHFNLSRHHLPQVTA